MIPLIGTIITPQLGLNPPEIEQAAVAARQLGVKIGRYLMSSHGLSENALFSALSLQFSMELLVDPEPLINMELLRELPLELFSNRNFIPIDIKDNYCIIAVADPLDFTAIQHIGLYLRLPVRIVLILPSEMERLHDKYFAKNSLFTQSAGKIAREYEQHLQVDDSLSIDEIIKRTESEPVVKMATLIFDEAIKLGASDIHVEPSEHRATVRFRIDGMLRQHTELTKWMFSPLTSRIKILADLDIAEKRSPQDGRIRYISCGIPYDFRVSTLPTHFGEKTVIRILKHDLALLNLANIGLSPDVHTHLSDLIEKPQGMIFVTGPTGSGKSSTLFACLNRISHKAINITTIENPIEYKLEGINQVQINEKAGVTFASALRSILRQDPDVILVGEIRDKETAQIAVQAAQTGHLVLSTLHTNDAISAITRMRDLGVPPFLIASSLLAVVAQRLVRVLCSDCKKEIRINEQFLSRWNKITGTEKPLQAYESVGCERCGGTGFKGRTGIFELIVINDSLRGLISENAHESGIRKSLKNDGFTSLMAEGIKKVENGITSPDELFRIIQIDEVT